MPYLDLKQGAIVQGRQCIGCYRTFRGEEHFCGEKACYRRELFPLFPGSSASNRVETMRRWGEKIEYCTQLEILMREYIADTFREHFKKCIYAQTRLEMMNAWARLEMMNETYDSLGEEDLAYLEEER